MGRWIVVIVVVAGLSAGTTWFAMKRAVSPAPSTPYQLTSSIREIMEGIVEPNADSVFESVAIINTAAGTEERSPKTDEDWARIDHAGLTLIEAANLLRMPGRVADHPGTPKSADSSEAVPE